MMMKKGLFGKSMMGGYDDRMGAINGTPATSAVSMPQNYAMQDGANLAQQQAPQRQPGFWQGGGKFTGRDALAAALAVIGDGFSGGRGAVGGLMEGRMAPQREAARLAEEQRKRAADLADYRSQMGIKAEFERPDAPKPGSFEWFSDPARTPQEKAAYGDYRDASTPDEPRMVTLPDGRAIFGTMDEIQRIIGGGAQGGGQSGGTPRVSNQQDYDALPAGAQYTDPNGKLRTKGGAASNGGGNF